MYKKILTIMMAAVIGCTSVGNYQVFAEVPSVRVEMGDPQNAVSLQEGIYYVPVAMKHSVNITNPSMAAGCLDAQGILTVHENQEVTLQLNLKTLEMNGGILGNAESVMIYQGFAPSGNTTEAMVLNTRMANYGFPGGIQEHEVPAAVSFTLPYTNQNGVYVKMVVDAMKNLGMASVDAYIAIDYANAIEKIDKTQLQNILNQASQKVESDYTKESYASLLEVIERAQELLDKVGVTQVELNEKQQELENAIAQLVEVGNKATLNNLIAEANTKKETSYTKESFQALKLAIVNAQNIAKDENATQEMVDEQVESLTNAIKNLVKLGDKTLLTSKLKVAKDKAASEYTTKTYEVLKKAMESAQLVYDDSNASQSLVDEQVKNLEAALAQLVKVTVNDPTIEGDKKPNTETGDNQDGNQSETSTPSKVTKTVEEVKVELWHETKDQASMAAGSLKEIAKIETSNGTATMTIYTQALKMGSLTGHLKALKVGGNAAKIVATDSDGNPTAFSFPLSSKKEEYLDLEVSADVMSQMMGVEYLGARLKISWDTLKLISKTTVTEDGKETTTQSSTSSTSASGSSTSTSKGSSSTTSVGSVKTGDETGVGMYVSMMLLAGISGGLLLLKKVLKRKGIKHEGI